MALHSTSSEMSLTVLFSSTDTTLTGMATVFPVRMAVFRSSVSCQRTRHNKSRDSLYLAYWYHAMLRHAPEVTVGPLLLDTLWDRP